jgi:hypothetical protein
MRHEMCLSLFYIALHQLSFLCDVSLSILLYFCSSMSWFICVHYDLLLKFGLGFHAIYCAKTICENRLLYLLHVPVLL